MTDDDIRRLRELAQEASGAQQMYWRDLMDAGDPEFKASKGRLHMAERECWNALQASGLLALLDRLERAEKDAARLDWLDDRAALARMGWRVGVAPVGNPNVQTVVGGGTTIRTAIDAAMKVGSGGSGA